MSYRPCLIIGPDQPKGRGWTPLGDTQGHTNVNSISDSSWTNDRRIISFLLVNFFYSFVYKDKNGNISNLEKAASAGNRTRIYCLEGNNANLYTTDAVNLSFSYQTRRNMWKDVICNNWNFNLSFLPCTGITLVNNVLFVFYYFSWQLRMCHYLSTINKELMEYIFFISALSLAQQVLFSDSKLLSWCFSPPACY